MSTLTVAQQRKLVDLEGIIERGMQTFVEVGAALSQIREQGLYVQTHGTFEEYVRDRWGWTDRRARQLMEAADVVGSLGETGKIFPVGTESHAAELAEIDDPTQRVEVWQTVVEETRGERITAKKVAEVRDRVVRPAREPDPAPTPEEYPWGEDDKWCWKLKNLYLQSPKRSQNAFRKWLLEASEEAA